MSEVVAEYGDVLAHYEYAPFGAVTVQSGASAAANPWRFSSEYAEDDTATVYYNYRHYELATGRWLSRDPSGEQISQNLYFMCSNDAIYNFDWLGLLASAYNDKRYKLYREPRCELVVSMKIRFVFVDDTDKPWTESNSSRWIQESLATVNDYFNGGYVEYLQKWYSDFGVNLKATQFKCKSNCATKCKDGVSVRFELTSTTGSDYDFKIKVHKRFNKRSYVNTDRSKVALRIADNIDDPGLVVSGEVDSSDNKKSDSSNGESQIVLIHEIGHLLGMNHPGQTDESLKGNRPKENSSADYDVNPRSLMGSGMVLEDVDFNDAFCSHLNNRNIGKNWKASSK